MDGASGASYTIFFTALTSTFQGNAARNTQATPVTALAYIWAAVVANTLKTLHDATLALTRDRTLTDALVPLIDALAGVDDVVSKAEAG